MMSLSTVIITGANRGIGFELTKRFLLSNEWKILACCRNPDGADALKDLAENSSNRVEICRLDLTNENSIKAFSEKISGRAIDVLLNNAGIMGGNHQSAFDMDFDAWFETFKVNTMAPLRMVQASIENLRQSSNPRIITISSQMGSLNRMGKGSYAYRSSKAALNKVMQVLAAELEQEGIIVTVMHPGWVQTDMGGKDADISPQASAEGLFRVITSLKKSDNGRFLQWTGEDHPW